MYSPKIRADLVPVLYRIGKAEKVPMTKLVDIMLRRALAERGAYIAPVVKPVALKKAA
jgi:hypothetical protein